MICKKCGRKLKDKKSIERGYGPICYGRIIGKYPGKNNTFPNREEEQIPGQMEFKDFPEILPENGVDVHV